MLRAAGPAARCPARGSRDRAAPPQPRDGCEDFSCTPATSEARRGAGASRARVLEQPALALREERCPRARVASPACAGRRSPSSARTRPRERRARAAQPAGRARSSGRRSAARGARSGQHASSGPSPAAGAPGSRRGAGARRGGASSSLATARTAAPRRAPAHRRGRRRGRPRLLELSACVRAPHPRGSAGRAAEGVRTPVESVAHPNGDSRALTTTGSRRRRDSLARRQVANACAQGGRPPPSRPAQRVETGSVTSTLRAGNGSARGSAAIARAQPRPTTRRAIHGRRALQARVVGECCGLEKRSAATTVPPALFDSRAARPPFGANACTTACAA